MRFNRLNKKTVERVRVKAANTDNHLYSLKLYFNVLSEEKYHSEAQGEHRKYRGASSGMETQSITTEESLK